MKKILNTVTSVQDLYRNFPNGGDEGWFAFVRGEQKFYEWKDEQWEEVLFAETLIVTSWTQVFENGIFNITNDAADTAEELTGTLKLIVFTDYIGKQVKVVQSGDKAYYLVDGAVFLLWSVKTPQESAKPNIKVPEYKGLLKPVLQIDDLYIDYPNGGELGWFSFVKEEKTFAYWDEDLNIWNLLAGGPGGGIQNLVAGSNITIDWSDPQNPVINAAGGTLTTQQVADQVDLFDEITSVTLNTLVALGGKKKAKTGVFYNFFKSAYDQLYAAATHSHTYNTLTGLPTLFSGAWADLTGKPTLFSGSYTDLTNKPTIPAAQQNADWNASSGVTQILNKPIIPAQYTDTDVRESALTGATQSTTLSNVTATDTQLTAWGKFMKLFVSLKALAFKDTIDYTSNDITNKPTLFNGDYNSLSNKPTPVDISGKVDKNGTDRLITLTEAANFLTAYNHSQTAHAPAGAQVNIIESISINGTQVAINAKNVNIVTDDSLDYSVVGGVLKFKLSDKYKNLIYAGL